MPHVDYPAGVGRAGRRGRTPDNGNYRLPSASGDAILDIEVHSGWDGPLEHVGDLAAATNGVAKTLCGGFESSTCLNHTYLVPIVITPCGGVINTAQGNAITGFAAVTLTAANCSGAGYCPNIPGCTGPTTGCACSHDNDCPGGANGACVQKYITVQPKFIDCNLAANAIICQRGFGATNSCPDCGTGTIRLVK